MSRDMFDKINKYNDGKKPEEQIKFLHGGSSAALAFMGKEVLVPKRTKTKINRDENKDERASHFVETEVIQLQRETLDKKLYATGILRKKFGVYPIGGELGVGTFGAGSGVRREGVNYKNISGMDPTPDGVKETYKYARAAKRFKSIEELHVRIKKIIIHMNYDSAIRSLKKLHMEVTNMMLMDPNGKEKKDFYINLILNERNNIIAANKDNKNLSEYLKKFDKWFDRIKEILAGKNLPFRADDAFRKAILNQYPIIYCSTMTGMNFKNGVPHERLIPGRVKDKEIEGGEIDLQTVRMMFTDKEHVQELQNTLVGLGLSHIIVAEFPLLAEEKAALQKDTIESVLTKLLNEYFNSGDKEKFDEATKILKTVYVPNKNNIALSDSTLYDILLPKVANDPDYIKNCKGAIDPEYFERLKKITYLFDLATLSSVSTDPRNSLDAQSAMEHVLSDAPLEKDFFEGCVLKLLANIDRDNDDDIDTRNIIAKAEFLQTLYSYLQHHPDRPFKQTEVDFLKGVYQPIVAQLAADDMETVKISSLYKVIYPDASAESRQSTLPAFRVVESISSIDRDILEKQSHEGVDEELMNIYVELHGAIQKLKAACVSFWANDMTDEEFAKIPSIQNAMKEYDSVTAKLDKRIKDIAAEIHRAGDDAIDFESKNTFFGKGHGNDKQPLDEWDIAAVRTRPRSGRH
jgi:hypothetical protein